MFERDTLDYKRKRNRNIKMLTNEAISGSTKMDTLPDNSLCFNGEAEAMYFLQMRKFFKNVVSRLVMG